MQDWIVNISETRTISQPQIKATWWIMLERFGRALFSFAILGIGVATLVWTVASAQSIRPHRVVPVIPWLVNAPVLPYLASAIFLSCGVGLFFQRTRVISSISLGVVMMVCGLVFDLPRHPDVMNPVWRTNLLEPIVIGSLAWLAFDSGEIPGLLHSAGRYLIAFSLVVFGVAHFQVLIFIAKMVPAWIPWHSFWTVFFGVAFIAAGLSFATGFVQRWAALGAGLMFGLWLATIHFPALLNAFAGPGGAQDPDKWSDVFIVTALWGGFWALLSDDRRVKR